MFYQKDVDVNTDWHTDQNTVGQILFPFQSK